MRTSADSAVPSMCQKIAMNISQNRAFISFGIRIFQCPRVKDRSGLVPASGANTLNIIQFSDAHGGLKDVSRSCCVPSC